MGSVVVISGPVAAGKSTVAKELVEISSGDVAYIEGDLFWPFFAKSAPSNRTKNFRILISSILAASLPYAKGGYEVILDFSIPPFFLESARKILTSKGIPVSYVVIRPSLSVCESRAANRSEGTIPDYSLYREMYPQFDEAEKFAIQDDESDAKQLAIQIRKGLDEGIYRIDA